MNPRIPAVLAMLAFLVPSYVHAQAKKIDPALAQSLGMSEDQIRDLCTYVTDVLDDPKNPKSYWTSFCEPDPVKLKEAQQSWKEDLNSFSQAAPQRKAQVQDLFNQFTGNPELMAIKDDSDHQSSQKVYRALSISGCISDIDCLSGAKAGPEFDPKINARTFPAWLSSADAAKMLPYMLIYENETLRQSKYKDLHVPVDEKERKKFCDDAKNKDACGNFEQTQKQITYNKAALDGMKKITDPAELSRFMENAIPRGDDYTESDQRKNGVLGQWRAVRDDPSMPLKPQQRLATHDTPAPSGPTTAPADAPIYSWNGMRTAAAGGLAAGSALLAWRSSRKKGEGEVAAEDEAAGRPGGDYVGPKTAEEARNASLPKQINRAELSPDEQRVYDWAHGLWENDPFGREMQDFESWFASDQGQASMGKNGKFSTDSAYKSLLTKVNAINGRANRGL